MKIYIYLFFIVFTSFGHVNHARVCGKVQPLLNMRDKIYRVVCPDKARHHVYPASQGNKASLHRRLHDTFLTSANMNLFKCSTELYQMYFLSHNIRETYLKETLFIVVVLHLTLFLGTSGFEIVLEQK